MAKLEVHGIYQLSEQLYRLGSHADIVADAMLSAGAKEMMTAWGKSIEELELVETGYLRDSFLPGKPKYYGGVKSMSVYPQGYDESGTPNAHKAWALDKGVPSKNIKAYHHLDLALSKAESTVVPAMQEVLTQYISTGNVPEIKIKENSKYQKKSKRK